MTSSIAFDNSYSRLPDRFYARLDPTPVTTPSLLKLNAALAEQLGLSTEVLQSDSGLQMLAGNQVPEGASPLAMAYAGHQFGGWSPQLGDGRALLLGEILDASGERYDLQLKGAGRTPFSRMGDGRAWVGPVLREYVVSEAMYKLGVPTTRALAAVATGESVHRETVLPGAVLTRVARSHIRVGTFEYFSARKDTEGLQLLTEYALQRHYPDLDAAVYESKQASALALLKAVIGRQSELVAHWQSLGFIHGVMNTDNVSITGDTIDYGPCAFMDTYHPAKVFSSIDQQGRYAYQNQPRIAQWNMAVLAQALLPLILEGSNEKQSEEQAVALAQQAVDEYPALYAESWLRRMRAKLGLGDDSNERNESDQTLITDLLSCMADQSADFTLVFRALSHLSMESNTESSAASSGLHADSNFLTLFDSADAVRVWLERWRQRLQDEGSNERVRRAAMCQVNPAYIPRNHRIEEMIQSAVNNDLEPLEKLSKVLADPYTEHEQFAEYSDPPNADQVVQHTFCGT
ncbi:MAG: YdiU family protein [Granulosicoccus sp.]|nr:YdiU family protein [Granulosicoccus sp.]